MLGDAAVAYVREHGLYHAAPMEAPAEAAAPAEQAPAEAEAATPGIES